MAALGGSAQNAHILPPVCAALFGLSTPCPETLIRILEVAYSVILTITFLKGEAFHQGGASFQYLNHMRSKSIGMDTTSRNETFDPRTSFHTGKGSS